MAFFDLKTDALHAYRPDVACPDDLEDFWRGTLAQELARPLEPRIVAVETPMTAYEVYDIAWTGFGGQRIQGWLRIPAHTTGRLPAVVQYRGYSGGRGYPWVDSHFAQAGYAHFLIEARGQGWKTPSLTEPTPDADPDAGLVHTPGVMTRGIDDPHTYYYRRLYVDALRLLELARHHHRVDPDRIALHGTSQGGGMAIAVAGLAGLLSWPVAAVMPNVPFLCHFERAVGLTDSLPYAEIAHFLAAWPHKQEQAFRTLSYMDGANLGRWSHAPSLWSTALMDQTCPPSTVFAAYHRWGGTDKDIVVYPWNGHEGGTDHFLWRMLAWLGERLG